MCLLFMALALFIFYWMEFSWIAYSLDELTSRNMLLALSLGCVRSDAWRMMDGVDESLMGQIQVQRK